MVGLSDIAEHRASSHEPSSSTVRVRFVEHHAEGGGLRDVSQPHGWSGSFQGVVLRGPAVHRTRVSASVIVIVPPVMPPVTVPVVDMIRVPVMIWVSARGCWTYLDEANLSTIQG